MGGAQSRHEALGFLSHDYRTGRLRSQVACCGSFQSSSRVGGMGLGAMLGELPLGELPKVGRLMFGIQPALNETGSWIGFNYGSHQVCIRDLVIIVLMSILLKVIKVPASLFSVPCCIRKCSLHVCPSNAPHQVESCSCSCR